MGEHNNFAELKKYARKSYGMHQGALMRKVVGSGLASHEIHNAVEGGICGTLVTYWVKDMLMDRRNSLFVPPPVVAEGVAADTFKQRTQFRHMIVAGVCMSDHAKYVKLRKGGDTRPALLILSPEGVSATQKGGERGFGDLLDFAFKAGAAYYVTLVCERARHAVGIHGTHGGGFTFFDPNAGEYEVPGLHFDRFLEAYRAVLRQKMGFGEITGIVISKGKLAPG